VEETAGEGVENGVEGAAESSSVDEDAEPPNEVVMIPMADMLNAAFERDNARLFAEDEPEVSRISLQQHGPGYTMITVKSIKAEEQILNTYGSPPNSELLRKYGHVDIFPLESDVLGDLQRDEIGGWPCGNPGDEVVIQGSLVVDAVMSRDTPETRAAVDERIDAWLEDDQSDDFPLTLREPLPSDLVSFVRVLLFAHEWERFSRKGKLPFPVVDSEVAEVLLKVLQNRQSRYAAGLQADVDKITTSSLTSVEKAALVVRIGEKRILKLAERTVADCLVETEERSGKRRHIQ